MLVRDILYKNEWHLAVPLVNNNSSYVSDLFDTYMQGTYYNSALCNKIY